MAEPTVYGFNKEDARVLADIAGREGLRPKNRAGSERRQLLGKYTCFLAKTGDEAISARDGDTPGSGTVTLQWYNKRSDKIEAVSSHGEDRTEKVKSFVAEESGTNAYVWIGLDAWGTMWYLNEACDV